MLAMLAIGSTAYGKDQLKVENLTISNSAESAFMVYFYSDVKSSISGLEFKIELPEGVEFVKDGDGSDAAYAVGSTFSGSVQANILSDGSLKVAMASGNYIRGYQGMLIAFKVKPTSSLEVGTLKGGKIKNITETPDGQTITELDDSPFDIEVTNCVVLDENSPFKPSNATNVDVLVKRAIKANTWSTILLPINVNNPKLKNAFGDDVKIAEFTGWSCDDETNVNDINIKFTTLATPLIKKGTPYLIYVSKNIEEFTINSASIDPGTSETIEKTILNEDIYDDDEMEYAKGIMTGKYALHAMAANDMFLQDNKFYYSVKGQNIKGLRATFRFKSPKGEDYLIPANAGARAMFSINGKPVDDDLTAINAKMYFKTGRVYSITGRFMGENVDMKSLPKGIYIVDGVKIIND